MPKQRHRLGRLVTVRQGQIDVPGGDGGDAGRRLVVRDGQLDVRMGPAERAEHRRQQMDAGGLEGADAQDPAGQAGQPRQFVPGLRQLVQHPARPRHQQLARAGQPGPAVVPYQQGRARLALQLGQLLGERRGGVAEPLGRARDRPRLRHRDQRGQTRRVVHGSLP